MRFLQANGFEFHQLSNSLLPLLEMVEGAAPPWTATDVSFPSFYVKSQSIYKAMALRDYCLTGSFGARYGNVPPAIQRQALRFRQIFYECSSGTDERRAIRRSFHDGSRIWCPICGRRNWRPSGQNWNRGPVPGDCPSAEKNWIALFKAAGGRDPAAMVSGAKTILESRRPTDRTALKFLVASGMAGALMQGNREESLRLWAAYRSSLFGAGEPDLLFRLLFADSTIPR